MMDSMGNPMTQQPDNKRRNLIIAVVVGVLLLCCCCVAIVAGAWACGDMLTGVSNSCGF